MRDSSWSTRSLSSVRLASPLSGSWKARIAAVRFRFAERGDVGDDGDEQRDVVADMHAPFPRDDRADVAVQIGVLFLVLVLLAGRENLVVDLPEDLGLLRQGRSRSRTFRSAARAAGR